MAHTLDTHEVHMQIRTRYEGPTDTRGSRVVAIADGKQKTMPWDYSCDIHENHHLAALKLARKLNPDARHLVSERMFATRSLRGYVFEVTEK